MKTTVRIPPSEMDLAAIMPVRSVTCPKKGRFPMPLFLSEQTYLVGLGELILDHRLYHLRPGCHRLAYPVRRRLEIGMKVMCSTGRTSWTNLSP